MKRFTMLAPMLTILLFASVALGQPRVLAPSGVSAVAALHDVTVLPDAEAPTLPPAAPDAGVATSTPTEPGSADGGATEALAVEATVTDAEGVTDGGEEPEPTVSDVVKEGEKAVDAFKNGQILFGMIAIVNILVMLTKFGFIKTLLGVRKWLRPLIAVVLGLVLGILTPIAFNGIAWYVALFDGFVAALSSAGFNELMNTLTVKGRAKRTG